MSALATGHRLSLRVVATNGSTTRRIAVEPPIATELPPTDLAEPRGVIRLVSGGAVPSKESASRAGIWPATLTGAASAIVPAVQVSATAPQEAALAIAPVGPGLEPIESAAGMSRVQEAGTGMRLEAAPEGTADQARAAAAVAVPPACHLGAEEDLVVVEAEDLVVVAEAAGAGSRLDRRKKSTGALI